MSNLKIVKDYKKDIQFLINALDSKEVSFNNKLLLNKCLEIELNNYLHPFEDARQSR